MVQREYVPIHIKNAEGWERYFAVNYLFKRILMHDSLSSDLELLKPQSGTFYLAEDGTIAQYKGEVIRLINISPDKIEESRLKLIGLLNRIPLVEI